MMHSSRTFISAAAFLAAFFSAAAAQSQQAAWTLAVIGDQQVPVEFPQWYDRFTSQTDWIAANAPAINLRMVTQVGDIVEHATDFPQWERASAAMQVLDTAPNADGGIGIPWNVAYGNHEIIGATRNPSIDLAGPEPSANYRQYFGSASGTHRYANQPEFGGVSSNDLNTWHIVRSSSAPDARPYLMLNLEIDVPGQKPGTNFDAILWAQSIIDAHPGMPTVITTHVFEGTKHGPPNNPYLFGFGHNSQLEIFDKLVTNNSQIFMVLSGHTSEDTHQIKLNNWGLPVLQMVTDYNKWLGTAGDGYFRLVDIDEAAGEVRVNTYSAYLNQYRTDANSQFTWTLDFHNRFDAEPGPCECPPSAPQLVAHWSLDDGQSNPNSFTATDAVAPHAHGTWQHVTTPRWISGIAGGAAEFGGSSTSADRDDVITVLEGGGKLDITGPLTLAAWIKHEEKGSPTSTRHIAGKDRSGGPDADAYSLKHNMIGSANTVQFMIASSGANTTLTSAQLLPAYTAASQHSGWVHVAGVFQPGEFMRLYIDGQLDAEMTSGVPLAIDYFPSTAFTIGRLFGSTQHSFNGGIDDVQLYNYALTDEQIAVLFGNPGQALVSAPALAGDYNDDGIVDAADYVLWRRALDIQVALANDDGLGAPVREAHYTLWRDNFGQSATGATSTYAAVPEPATAAMALLGLAAWGLRRTRPRG